VTRIQSIGNPDKQDCENPIEKQRKVEESLPAEKLRGPEKQGSSLKSYDQANNGSGENWLVFYKYGHQRRRAARQGMRPAGNKRGATREQKGLQAERTSSGNIHRPAHKTLPGGTENEKEA